MRRSWELRPITKEQQERFARIIASCYQPPEPFTADQYTFRQAAEPEFERQFFPMEPPDPVVKFSKPASLEYEPPLVLEFESPEAVNAEAWERFNRGEGVEGDVLVESPTFSLTVGRSYGIVELEEPEASDA